PYGLIGTWTFIFQHNSTCPFTGSFSTVATESFDVARVVIVGAFETAGVGGDTYVREDAATTIFGAAATMNVRADDTKKRRGLVRMELDSLIPGSATISSARLRLNLNTTQATHSIAATRVTST